MLFILRVIVYVLNFKKLCIDNDTGARGVENHELDKFFTSGEQFFL